MKNESYCSYCLAPFSLGYNKEKGICKYCKHEWKLETIDYSDQEKKIKSLHKDDGPANG